MKAAITGVVVALIATMLLVGLTVATGLINVGADSPPPGFVESFLHTAMERSVAVRADDVTVPPLDDENLITEGAAHYQTMCVDCHGAPGVSPGEIAQGLTPAPPELAKSASGDEPAELFWVTKHGIQMTGMPAWGATHDDESIWGMVALMSRFGEMTPAEYQALTQTAGAHRGGGGHHDSAPDNDEHDHGSHDH